MRLRKNAAKALAGALVAAAALTATAHATTNTVGPTDLVTSADSIPFLATETSLTGAPNPVNVGGAVMLTAAVSATGVADADPTPDPTGTVAFTAGGTPIAGCGAVPLVNGTANCPTTAPVYSSNPSYEAAYSGDDVYIESNGDTHVRVRDISTTVASVAPNPVPRLAPITYTAEISGAAPVGGEVTPLQVLNNGTVAFSVDGVPVADCATRPVSNVLVATCSTLAPPVAGPHTLTANYTGGTALSPSSADKDFVVLAPAVTLPETVDFASVQAGETSTRTVVLTNSGGANLAVSAASVKVGDAYSITADACSDVTLEPGAGCSVQVAFHPPAAGAYAGTLVFTDDAGEGTHSTALTGTGVAAPVPPTPPAPTATPTPTPQPGATLAPGAKPTLTVTAPPSSNPNAAPTLSLPLSCPANEECQLDGTLKIDTSALSKSVRAAAVETTTVARFSKVQIAQGKLKTIKLKLSPTFIRSAQKRGIRRIKATLTINTVLGSGQRMTTRQQVTVLIPKAAKRKVAAPKAQPKFTG